MEYLKIAFGVITRELQTTSPFLNFLINAEKYDHKIANIFLRYDNNANSGIIAKLQEYSNVQAIQVKKPEYLEKTLKGFDLTQKEIATLIKSKCLESHNLMSYGTKRNQVLLTALLQGIDILIFFDTDVYPQILFEDGENDYKYEEVDFVGSHIKILNENPKAVATTSDYTGYYIIPHMNFPHLDDLLNGLQKENSLEYISYGNRLVLKHGHAKNIHPTQKVLGGNLAIDLRKLKLLTPFFSTTLEIDGECYLGRGEDTLFGPLITKYGGQCIDIDLPIFHNCFGDFPNEPDINQAHNLDRFFYACMGWLIRNPFYNWLHSEYVHDFPPIDVNRRYEAIKRGSKEAAKAFNDERFLRLPKTFTKAYAELDKSKETFYNLINTWGKLKNRLV